MFQRTQEVTDALVTLLIEIVHRIGKRAERRVESAYINDLKQVKWKNASARSYCRCSPSNTRMNPFERWCILSPTNKPLRDLVAEYKAQGESIGKKCKK